MPTPSQHILFIAYCWGGAGSTWLAWALNCHKHVFCLHAPNVPRFARHKREDALALVNAFYSLPALAKDYECVGFTHGVRREWHAELVQTYGDRFRGFVLIRHPIRRINSLTALKLQSSQKRPLSLRERFARRRNYAKLRAASKRTDFPKDAAALSFYHSCNAVNRIVSEVATGIPIYRLEDLVGTVEKFQEVLHFISGGNLTMAADDIREIQGTVKGKHAPKRLSVSETYAEWSDIQKEAFRYLVTPQAIRHYQQLGYEFPDAVLHAATR